MRQTLFYLPHQVGPLPLFGLVSWGMLGFLVYIAVIWFYQRSQPKDGSAQNATGTFGDRIFNWGLGAVILGFVLPMAEAKVGAGTPDEIPIGLPVRGYGLMMMLGVSAATALSYRRVLQLGVPKDSFMSLVLFTVIGGLAGARVFYVVQKWSELAGQTILEKLWTALQFTEGGLVVYGAVLGGITGILSWAFLQRVRPLALLDAIVPAFFIGLAFGRLGCLLNGCCFGGICETNTPAISFPLGSPAYIDQLESGRLLGINTNPSNQNEISSIDAGTWAEKQGILPGDHLESIEVGAIPLSNSALAEKIRAHQPTPIEAVVHTDRGNYATTELPPKSLPVHPSQIYASITAFLLCFWSTSIPRWTARPGLVFGSGWLVYGILRYIEEIIRVDEAGQFGTNLSIAQWVSIVGILFGIALTLWVFLRPAKLEPTATRP
jgi:phosphatidylglycerol:prolipoprotein diacylglycerol transferase